ncbi:MAG: hypothetical protein OEY49_19315, partial [Candidatus Heimdallarchaeota archaeon]|nr:hypothetical protein [Candidatus Heimdallarchaeota archaeon]
MTITIPSSFTQGDILVATGSSTVSVLNATTSGFVLTSNGAGTQPSWQAIPGDGIWIKELTNDIHYDLGDIGIGISTPEEILHAFKSVGDIALKVETSALNGDSGLHLKNDAREWKLMIDGSDDDTFKITDITGSNIPLIINTSGKIGIDGTPTQKLDIHERSASPLALRLNQDNVVKQNVGIRLDRQGSETWFAGMNATDDKYILRQGGTTELLTVDTSGNVDISGDLKVNSDNYIPLTLSRNNSALNSGLGIKFDHLNSLSNMVNYSIIQDKIVDNTSGSEDGQIDFYTRVAGTLTKHLSLVAGNIGIGDTPEANTKLHLKFSDTNNPPLKIENQAVNSSAILSLKNDAREYILYNHGQDSDKLKIRDQTAGVDRIMLDTSGNLLVNSGNIGIGAAAASYNGRGNLLSIGNGVATMPGFVLKPASAWNTNSG